LIRFEFYNSTDFPPINRNFLTPAVGRWLCSVSGRIQYFAFDSYVIQYFVKHPLFWLGIGIRQCRRRRPPHLPSSASARSNPSTHLSPSISLPRLRFAGELAAPPVCWRIVTRRIRWRCQSAALRAAATNCNWCRCDGTETAGDCGRCWPVGICGDRDTRSWEAPDDRRPSHWYGALLLAPTVLLHSADWMALS
jgi:hypothetical protein